MAADSWDTDSSVRVHLRPARRSAALEAIVNSDGGRQTADYGVRLARASATEPARAAFLDALRRYADDTGGGSQSYDLERLVRTSRDVGTDGEQLPQEARTTLAGIASKYSLLAGADTERNPITYWAARRFIAGLFF